MPRLCAVAPARGNDCQPTSEPQFRKRDQPSQQQRRRRVQKLLATAMLATDVIFIIITLAVVPLACCFETRDVSLGPFSLRSSQWSPQRQQHSRWGERPFVSRDTKLMQRRSTTLSSVLIDGRRRRQGLEMVATTTTTTSSTFGTTATEATDITMNDVVASASFEIQKQNNKVEFQKQQEHNRQRGAPFKTPFEWFEDHDKARIQESERVGLDRLRENDDTEPPGSGTWGGTIHPSEIVSWEDLQALRTEGLSPASAEWSSSAYYRRLRELHATLEASGGFLVVRLEKDEASTVADMWSTMDAYFSLPSDQQQVDRQVLEKEDGSHDLEAGYHFRQTYMNIDGEILPETIQNALENHHHHNRSSETSSAANSGNSSNDRDAHNRGIEGSYKLFADITKTVGTIVAAGALEKDLALMDKAVTSMLDDRNGHPFVNADHRLSRYILGNSNGNQNNQNKESLISHTDWTFTTCIPLSAIPGLQVWRPSSREWVVPEAVLGADRTSYVVVMAGKWIELLTNGKISSCVHRVVTQQQQQQGQQQQPRLSAPFFCRTKRMVFDLFRDEFHESWRGGADDESVLSKKEAIESMGRLFGDWIRFLEGDRDPDIPGCVLDLGLDRADKVPDCYSIEDVLGK